MSSWLSWASGNKNPRALAIHAVCIVSLTIGSHASCCMYYLFGRLAGVLQDFMPAGPLEEEPRDLEGLVDARLALGEGVYLGF